MRSYRTYLVSEGDFEGLRELGGVHLATGGEGRDSTPRANAEQSMTTRERDVSKREAREPPALESD